MTDTAELTNGPPVTVMDAPPRRVNKTDLVRQILKEQPEIKPIEGAEIIKQRFGVEMSPSLFSTIKSNERRASGEPPRQRKLRQDADDVQATRTLPMPGAITVEEVERVREVAREFGGVPRLRKCLEALERLQG